MPRLTIGTSPVQALRPNSIRAGREVVFLPSSIIAGNTGLVFAKYGGPPGDTGTPVNTDITLNAGASLSEKIADGYPPQHVREELWLVSDTADQIVVVNEFNEG